MRAEYDTQRRLRHERWTCGDPVWWRATREFPLQPMTGDDIAALASAFAVRGRAQLIDT